MSLPIFLPPSSYQRFPLVQATVRITSEKRLPDWNERDEVSIASDDQVS
jgi:hypothetical protein